MANRGINLLMFNRLRVEKAPNGRGNLPTFNLSPFQSVIRWAKEECLRKELDDSTESQRQVLGNALQLIRFPLMTIEEFAQTAGKTLLAC